MIMNERISQDFFKRIAYSNPAISDKEKDLLRHCLIDVKPSTVTTTAGVSCYQVAIILHADDYTERKQYNDFPEQLVFGYTNMTEAQKQSFIASDEYKNLKTAIENGDKLPIADFVDYVENQITVEEIDMAKELVRREHICDMDFGKWNVYTEDYEEGADLIVELGTKKAAIEEMTRLEMMNHGMTREQADDELKRGDFVAFVQASDSKVDWMERFAETNGGFQVVNPERASGLFFLKENSEVVGTGYFFTDAERKILHELCAELINRDTKDKKEME